MTFEEVWNNSSYIVPLISKEEGQHLWDQVIQLPENSVVVEIGSYVGKSSFILASACLERNSKLICIDPFVVGFDGITHFENTREIFKENILNVFDNVTLFDMTSQDAIKHIKKKIDFLFVDGDHDYEGVVLDCKNYLPKLKNGNNVCFHDFTNRGLDGVRQGVEEFCGNWEVVANVWSMTTRRKP